MKITHTTAIKLWNDVYGETTQWAADCFGTWMHKDDYGDTVKLRVRPGGDGNQYCYGWAVDHIMPQAKGGKDDWNNLEPMHIHNNQAKSDYISFKVNEEFFQVVRCDLCDGYGIKNQRTGQRVDWKGVQKRWYR